MEQLLTRKHNPGSSQISEANSRSQRGSIPARTPGCQGTLSWYAALNTAPGRVHGQTTPRPTRREFVAFLKQVVALGPSQQEIPIILDNLSAHQTQAVEEFLQQNPRVHFHFTPTYSSWLNPVKLWFGKIERKVIARRVFTSVQDLARKLRRYLNAYSVNARPFRWNYADPSRRIGNDFKVMSPSKALKSATTRLLTQM